MVYLRDKILIPIVVLIGCIFLAICAKAQDDNSLRVYAGFSNYNVSVHREGKGIPDSTGPYQQALKGFGLEGSYKLLGYEYIKLEGVASFAAHYQRANSNSYQFLGGPQLSYALFRARLSPFVRGLFGSTYVYGQHIFTKTVGTGIDLSVNKHVFFRPGVIDFQYANAEPVKGQYYPIRSTRVGFGLGLQF